MISRLVLAGVPRKPCCTVSIVVSERTPSTKVARAAGVRSSRSQKYTECTNMSIGLKVACVGRSCAASHKLAARTRARLPEHARHHPARAPAGRILRPPETVLVDLDPTCAISGLPRIYRSGVAKAEIDGGDYGMP